MRSAKLRLHRPEKANAVIKALLAIFVALAVIRSATAGPLERQQISREYGRASSVHSNLTFQCGRYVYDSPAKAQCEASILQVEDQMNRLRQRFEEDKRREPPQELDPEDSKYLTPNDAIRARQEEAQKRTEEGVENIFRGILGLPAREKVETIPHTSSEFAAFVAQSCPKYWGSLPQSRRSHILTNYPGANEDVKRATVKQCVDLERALPQ